MKLSLSQKVFFLIIVLLGIQSLFLSYYSEQMTETVLLDESRKQAQVFLNGLEREISASPDLKNPDFLQKKIERAINRFHELNFSIYRLYMYNSQGVILADSLKKFSEVKEITGYKKLVFTQGKHILGDDVEYKTDLKTNKPVAITDVIVPLDTGEHVPMEEGSHVIAAIEIEINIEHTLKNIKRIDNLYENKITYFILISGLVFMLLLWGFLKLGVLTPIQSIEKTAKKITQGNLESRTHLRSNDEIAQLGLSINNMAESIQHLLTTQENAYIQVLQSLAKALEAKDPYTAGHSGRVAKFSVDLGNYLNLPEKELKILKQGALMHDLGKIAIPDHILNKPDKLSEEEFKIMRSHPIKTSDIMKPIRHYDQHREIAAWHHERWDGKGYPDGLTGEEIPLLARIVAIADTWDAMTGDRVYRKGMTEEKALSILVSERDDGQWDPQLVDKFVQMVKN